MTGPAYFLATSPRLRSAWMSSSPNPRKSLRRATSSSSSSIWCGSAWLIHASFESAIVSPLSGDSLLTCKVPESARPRSAGLHRRRRSLAWGSFWPSPSAAFLAPRAHEQRFQASLVPALEERLRTKALLVTVDGRDRRDPPAGPEGHQAAPL